MAAIRYVSLLAFVVTISFGHFVNFQNPRSRVNRAFLLFMVAIAFWGLAEFCERRATSADEAAFWGKVYNAWMFTESAGLYFALVYTEKYRLASRIWVKAALLVPPVAFTLIDVRTGALQGPPVLAPWGWTFTVPDTTAYMVSSIWTCANSALMLALLIGYARRLEEPKPKAQARLVGLSIAITLVIGLLTENLPQVLDLHERVPAMTAFANCLAGGVIGYSIWRHDLFALDPAAAADSIVATISDGLFLLSPAGDVRTVNRATCELLGCSEADLLGRPMTALLGDARVGASRGQEFVSDLLAGSGALRQVDTSLVSPRGKRVRVSLSSAVMRDAWSKPMAIVVTARDITEKEQAADSLRIARQQLSEAEKLSALGRLLAQVSHEVNNPLNVIHNNIEPMKDYLRSVTSMLEEYRRKEAAMSGVEALRARWTELDLDFVTEDFGKALSAVAASTARVRSIQSDMRAFLVGDIEARLPGEVNVPVRAVVEELGRGLPPEVELVAVCGEDLPLVPLNAGRLGQVLWNLVQNALDAVGERGVVTVRTEPAPGGGVHIEVSDTGAGVAPSLRSRIFEPFFTTKGARKGTGLGLAVCRQIVVEEHHGTLELELGRESGAHFLVTLPPSSAEDTNRAATTDEFAIRSTLQERE